MAALGGVALVAACGDSCLRGFPVADVVKALYEGFPAFEVKYVPVPAGRKCAEESYLNRMRWD